MSFLVNSKKEKITSANLQNKNHKNKLIFHFHLIATLPKLSALSQSTRLATFSFSSI